MGLTYFGLPFTHNSDQEAARKYLKPDMEDQNVSPWQMVDYVNLQMSQSYNVRALARYGGDFEMIRLLLANDFPVIIEKGFEEESNGEALGWMGHYLLLMGYDNTQQIFYTYDSYLGTKKGEGREEAYDHIAHYWRHFNQLFIVLYAPEREAQVQAILGDLWDEQAGYARAKTLAQQEAATNPSDYWAWFNLGEAAVGLGEYQVAAVAFDQAINQIGGLPRRLMWYRHGPFEAFYQTGQFNTVLELTWLLEQVTPYIEESNYYEGLVYAAQGNRDAAINRFNQVLEFNPNFYPAAQALEQVLSGTFVGPAQTDA
jgi:tetratricopeptide (TPR) repeat protein